MSDFQEFPKIPRLSRQCVITEKIDGTNAQVFIEDDGVTIRAGSRSRWIDTVSDNYGFAKWVQDHAEELRGLGPGRHFGEWWGGGIQRGYGFMKGEKFFSLFNVGRWNKDNVPSCVGVVPTLYVGPFTTEDVDQALMGLSVQGSAAAPGFMRPEGVVVFHSQSNSLYKKTIEKDAQPKGAA